MGNVRLVTKHGEQRRTYMKGGLLPERIGFTTQSRNNSLWTERDTLNGFSGGVRGSSPLARISAPLLRPLGLGKFEAELASVPPGDGGVGGEAGVAEDG